MHIYIWYKNKRNDGGYLILPIFSSKEYVLLEKNFIVFSFIIRIIYCSVLPFIARYVFWMKNIFNILQFEYNYTAIIILNWQVSIQLWLFSLRCILFIMQMLRCMVISIQCGLLEGITLILISNKKKIFTCLAANRSYMRM